MRTKIIIPVEKPYVFTSTLRSHGWVSLLPNIPDESVESFSRAERLSSGRVINLFIASSEAAHPEIFVTVKHDGKLPPGLQNEIKNRVAYMLRLNENLQGFYDLCSRKGNKWKNLTEGKGYLLRSSGVFEDLVKVICTTNIQWGGTKRMAKELVDSFGSPFPGDLSLRSFPAPESISAVSLKEFKNRVRLGYRADYVYELSARISNGELKLNDLLDTSTPTTEIKRQLLAIKGVGNYAAASMLMLLGRYDQIPVDTVFRQFIKEKYFKDKQFSEEEGLRIYEEWGQWKYLAYWNEMLAFYYPKAEIE